MLTNGPSCAACTHMESGAAGRIWVEEASLGVLVNQAGIERVPILPSNWERKNRKIVERLLLRPYDCVTLPSRSRGQDASGRAGRWLSSIWGSADRREKMVCLMRMQRGSLTRLMMDCAYCGVSTQVVFALWGVLFLRPSLGA